MSITNNQYHTLSLFQYYDRPAFLCITKDNDNNYQFDRQRTVPTPEECHKNIRYIYELIGTQRLNRILKEQKIELTESTPLSRKIVKKIVLGLRTIHKDDRESDAESIEEQYHRQLPFQSFNEWQSVFALRSEKVEKLSPELQYMLNRTTATIRHHFHLQKPPENREQTQCTEIEFITSRLANNEMQPGEVIHLHDGYFYIEKTFIGGGAYLAALRNANTEISTPTKIVCRGTALKLHASQNWQSVWNDLLFHIGSWGIKSCWEQLSKYLIENKTSSVEIFGNSLGGAHAQALSVFIEGLLNIPVRKLTTYCSVGGSKPLNDLFKKEILPNRASPFSITIVRKGGTKEDFDYTPLLGDTHLGADTTPKTCNVSLYYLLPPTCNSTIIPQKTESLLSLGERLFTSLLGVHRNQMTLKDFHWEKIEASKISEHLNLGTILEPHRQKMANILAFFTKSEELSLTDYFYSQRARSHNTAHN